MKLLSYIITLSLLSIIMTSCGKKNTEESFNKEYSLQELDSIGKAYKPTVGKYGGTINLPLAADPDGFCPALSSSGYSQEVMSYIFEGLVTLDPITLEYIPNLAENWNVSKDGLTWIFNLKKGILFSDSTELTADDVVFTYNDVIYNDKLNSPLNYNFRVDNKKIIVKKEDRYTVSFTLPQPFAPFLTVASAAIMPKHKYINDAQNGTLESKLSSGANPNNVIGTGPFKLSKVELGQKIELVRNPLYRKVDSAGNRLPYLDGIKLLVIKEPNVQMMKFQNGELDQISIQGEHYPLLKPEENKRGYRIYRVGPSWYDAFFKFNENNQLNDKGKPFLDPVKQKWFRSKEFRQAAAYAINYDQIIKIIYNGLAYPPAGVWGKHKGKYHNPNAKLYSYNPQKADSLLKSIGMIDRDGDGYREDKDGNIVEFTLTTSAGVKLIEDTYAMVRKDFENIGIKVHLNLIEFNTLIAKTMNTYDWDAVAFAMGGINDPHFGMSSWCSNSARYIINPQRKDSKGNIIPKVDRDWELEINEIFVKAASEMDDTKRKELYWRWQEISQEECTTIYMPLKETIMGIQNRFGNIKLNSNIAFLGTIFNNIEEIYIK